MSPLTAFTPTLPDDILLDSGVLYVGGSPLGVSRGGLTFNPSKEVRNVEFDGKRADITELDRILKYAATIGGTFIEINPSKQLPKLEPGHTSSSPGSNVTTRLTPKPAGQLFAAGDYLTDLRLIFERTDGSFVQVRFPKALCLTYELKGTDGSEAEIACEFHARQTLADAAVDLGTAPYLIEYLNALS